MCSHIFVCAFNIRLFWAKALRFSFTWAFMSPRLSPFIYNRIKVAVVFASGSPGSLSGLWAPHPLCRCGPRPLCIDLLCLVPHQRQLALCRLCQCLSLGLDDILVPWRYSQCVGFRLYELAASNSNCQKEEQQENVYAQSSGWVGGIIIIMIIHKGSGHVSTIVTRKLVLRVASLRHRVSIWSCISLQ